MSINLSRCVTLVMASVILTHAGTLEARPCAAVPADAALSVATLVVKGTLIANHSDVGPPGSDATSTIRVERVLKGRTNQSSMVITHFLCGQQYDHALNGGRPFIAFIVASSGHLVGDTAILPASYASARVTADPATALREELLRALDEPDRRTARAAVGALAELDGREAMPMLRRAAGAADFGTRFRALSWLTRFGDPDAFAEVVRVVSAPAFITGFQRTTSIYDEAQEPLLTATSDLRNALHVAAVANAGVDGSPPGGYGARFVSLTGTLAQLPNSPFRREAIALLRRLRAPGAFPVLADALRDPDENIRYDAMMTFCTAMRAPDLPCPGWDTFRKDERVYIDRVRAWWNAQQR